MGLTIPDRTPTLRVSDEEIVVALLMPHASVDGRVFKLIVRLLQRTSLDAKSLWFLARRERADRVLYWLSHSVPQSERAGSIVPLLACCPGPPRGYQGLRFNYDASRLIRRVATKESVWKAARR